MPSCRKIEKCNIKGEYCFNYVAVLHGLAGQLGREGWQARLVGRHMQVGSLG